MSPSRFYRFAVAFSLFLKSSAPEEATDINQELENEESEFSRIRCPLCHWQPNGSSVWQCADCGHPENFFGGCGTIWNTFTTHGLCPGCGHQWRWTACLRCYGWSPHEEWYTKESL
jgi:rubrerythrin